VDQALYLAFVSQAAEPDHPIDDVILNGDLIAPVGATMATRSNQWRITIGVTSTARFDERALETLQERGGAATINHRNDVAGDRPRA